MISALQVAAFSVAAKYTRDSGLPSIKLDWTCDDQISGPQIGSGSVEERL